MLTIPPSSEKCNTLVFDILDFPFAPLHVNIVCIVMFSYIHKQVIAS